MLEELEFSVKTNENIEFNLEENYHSYIYESIANEVNEEERIFREKTRFEKKLNWTVFRRMKRLWKTAGGNFWLNITMYQTVDEKTKKKKRFIYRHHLIIDRMKHSSFDFALISQAIFDYLEGRKANKNTANFPSKQMVNYFIKKYKIRESIFEKNNQKKIEILEMFSNSKNKEIDANIDDLFLKTKENKTVKNLRQREVIFNIPNALNKGGIALFFSNFVGEQKSEKSNFQHFVDGLKNKIDSWKWNHKNITINGDGAPWMKSLSKALKLDYVLDFFHLKMYVFHTFGYSKYAKKITKKFFKNWYSLEYKQRWCEVFNDIFDGQNYEAFLKAKEHFLEEIKAFEVPKEISENINNFFKYISKNKDFIWDKNGNLMRKSSYTEHCVYHLFKKSIKKYHSLYSAKNVEMLVIYQNLKRNFTTIFVD